MKYLVAVAMVAAVVFAWIAPYPAWGHDSWIADGMYRSPVDGMLCCNRLDCSVIPSDQVKITPTGYVIETIGDVVPFNETIPSEDGDYHRCQRPDGSRRCFFAPGFGS